MAGPPLVLHALKLVRCTGGGAVWELSLLLSWEVVIPEIFLSHTPLHFDTLSPGDWKRVPPAKASKSPVMNYETTVKHKVLLSTYYAH